MNICPFYKGNINQNSILFFATHWFYKFSSEKLSGNLSSVDRLSGCFNYHLIDFSNKTLRNPLFPSSSNPNKQNQKSWVISTQWQVWQTKSISFAYFRYQQLMMLKERENEV